MISGGDELSRTQNGNNNAYCQDSEVSWYHWDLDARRADFLEFAQAGGSVPQTAPELSPLCVL